VCVGGGGEQENVCVRKRGYVRIGERRKESFAPERVGECECRGSLSRGFKHKERQDEKQRKHMTVSVSVPVTLCTCLYSCV